METAHAVIILLLLVLLWLVYRRVREYMYDGGYIGIPYTSDDPTVSAIYQGINRILYMTKNQFCLNYPGDAAVGRIIDSMPNNQCPDPDSLSYINFINNGSMPQELKRSVTNELRSMYKIIYNRCCYGGRFDREQFKRMIFAFHRSLCTYA